MLDRDLRFSSGPLAGNKIKTDRNIWDYVLQAGFDVNLKDGWLLNAVVKYVTISTDVKANLSGSWIKVVSLDIHPWVIGFGIGRKF